MILYDFTVGLTGGRRVVQEFSRTVTGGTAGGAGAGGVGAGGAGASGFSSSSRSSSSSSSSRSSSGGSSGGGAGAGGGGAGGASGSGFFRSSSSSSRTGPDGVTRQQSTSFMSGAQGAGTSAVSRFAKFRDEDELINSNRVSASSLVPVAAKNPTITNLLGLMNIKAQTVRSGNSDARQLATSTLDEILAKTGASLLGTRAYAPRPLPRVKMSVS